MKKGFQSSWLSFFILLLVTSCAIYKEPELEKVGNFQFEKLKGKSINFSLETTVDNPNWYAIKIKPSTVDVYVENLLIGQLTLQSTVRYARKSHSIVNAPLTASLANGALINLVRLAGKNEVEVVLKGKVKAGVWFISKKIPVENKQTIDGELLRFGLP
jgi:LEA14-like dessication related protein